MALIAKLDKANIFRAKILVHKKFPVYSSTATQNAAQQPVSKQASPHDPLGFSKQGTAFN